MRRATIAVFMPLLLLATACQGNGGDAKDQVSEQFAQRKEQVEQAVETQKENLDQLAQQEKARLEERERQLKEQLGGSTGSAAPGATGSQPNTGQNAAGGPTAQDQSNDPADLALVQKVRSTLTSTEGMSINAQNLKIITSRGRVTLRGPVKDEAERQAVLAKVRAVPGVSVVQDELTLSSGR